MSSQVESSEFNSGSGFLHEIWEQVADLFGDHVRKIAVTYPLVLASLSDRSLGAINMKSYKFYLKDREDVVIGSGGFDAEDSDTAIRIVRVRSTVWPLSCHSYELLQDDSVIHCESLVSGSETKKHD